MHEYILRISLEKETDPGKINGIIGLNGIIDEMGEWVYSIVEKDDDQMIDYIDLFYTKLVGKFKELEQIGVSRERITIWHFYEYNKQCNFEFNPDDFKKLDQLGVTLCISCWQQ